MQPLVVSKARLNTMHSMPSDTIATGDNLHPRARWPAVVKTLSPTSARETSVMNATGTGGYAKDHLLPLVEVAFSSAGNLT